MAVELLQTSTVEVITTDLTVEAELEIHADATFAVFFVGVEASNVASDQDLFGILHKYNTGNVSIMRDAPGVDQNDRKYRFQMGRKVVPSPGTHTYQVEFGYTGRKTVLITALSYKGVQLSDSGLEGVGVSTESNFDNPTSIGVTSTGAGDFVVDAMLYREIIPFQSTTTVTGTAPTASGGQDLSTISGVYTIHNEDWGIVTSSQQTVASGVVDMGWFNFDNTHAHLAGLVVAS